MRQKEEEVGGKREVENCSTPSERDAMSQASNPTKKKTRQDRTRQDKAEKV